MLRVSAVALTFLIATTSAIAGSFLDATTGLGVRIPDGYSYEGISPSSDYAIAIQITRIDGRGLKCAVGFINAPKRSTFPQGDINAAMASEDRQQFLAAAVSASFDIEEQSIISVNGVSGTQFTIHAKGASDAKGHLVILETPPGRTSISCEWPANDPVASAAFLEIRDNLTLPG
jgi:hypothetical protein